PASSAGKQRCCALSLLRRQIRLRSTHVGPGAGTEPLAVGQGAGPPAPGTMNAVLWHGPSVEPHCEQRSPFEPPPPALPQLETIVTATATIRSSNRPRER